MRNILNRKHRVSALLVVLVAGLLGTGNGLASPNSQPEVVGMSARGWHTLYLKSDGTVWATGRNYDGQLGDGTYVDIVVVPMQISRLSDVTAVAAGVRHSLFLKSDGTVWVAGSNAYGQLGIGTSTSKEPIPERISSLSGVTAVAAGFDHSLFLKSDGTVWATGGNRAGQLGDGTTADKSTPVQVMGLTDVVAIAAGDYHSLFLKSDGTVWATGGNGAGQLGDGTNADTSTLVQVSGISDVVSVAAGSYHSFFIKSDKTVWATGNNLDGQLGDGTTVPTSILVQLSGMSDVVSVATGNFHSLFLKGDGTVWATGYNGNGQFGDGTTVSRSIPVLVMSDSVTVAAGAYHSLFLKSDGTVWASGDNSEGQLGDGTGEYTGTPMPVIGFSEATAAVAAGYDHSLFVKNDGSVWATGSNEYGQLGDWLTLDDRFTPAQIAGLSEVVEVSGGARHSLFLKSDGTVWAAGWNSDGQLGDGTATNKSTPVQVKQVIDVVAVAAGAAHSLFLKSDKTVWATGNGESGQLGIEGGGLGLGSRFFKYLPEQVMSDVVAVATHSNHSLFLKSDGTAWATGLNSYGQLGIGTNVSAIPTPVQVLSEVAAVAAGSAHSLFLKTDGTVWATGYNYDGQLGDGTNIDRSTPVQVMNGVAAVFAGNDWSLFLKGDGTVWATGANNYGQLGDPTAYWTANWNYPNSPKQVMSDVATIAAGSSHSLFLKNDGSAWATGQNTYGQLGTGAFLDKSTPVQVLGLDTFLEGYVDDPNLSWLYRFTPNWAWSGTMSYVYLANWPWIYSPKFGYFLFNGDDIRTGAWIYFASTGKWAWLVESNGGYFLYLDGTYNNFLNPIPN